MSGAFLLDAATYLIPPACFPTYPSRPQREEEEVGVFRELRSGFSYLAGARVPLAVMIGAFLTVLATDLAIPAEVFLARVPSARGTSATGCW